jgi:crotonobetainyl-CoA:carnitine CoA-transferase CaiB-like acyl-CoA transferase
MEVGVMEWPLSGLRVADLSAGIAGGYCTKVLADGGAEVIKLEPPEGDGLRRWSAGGTLAAGADGALFQFLACSKSSVVIDPDDRRDRELARQIVTGADVVVWSEGSRLAEQPEFAPARLRELAPGAVVVAVTPWGLAGPWTGRPWTDATLQALSGALMTRGDPDRPPVVQGGAITEWAAGAMAAVGLLAARWRAARTGAGDLVDVSMLEAALLTLTMYTATWESIAGAPMRASRQMNLPGIHQTKDGFVGFMVVTGQQWLDFCVLVEQPDWLEDESLGRFNVRSRRRRELVAAIDAWAARRTTAEVLELADALRVPASEVTNGATVTSYEHFVRRNAFLANPRSGFLQPDVPYTLSGGARRRPPAPAPLLGEHTAALPFAGLRVAGLTMNWAGPIISHVLAMYGADVIRVESIQRPDGLRFQSVRPMTEDHWWEWAPLYQGPNTNKRDLTLIMVRAPAFGLSGPLRDRGGYTQTMEMASGLAWLTGHPDAPPHGVRRPQRRGRAGDRVQRIRPPAEPRRQPLTACGAAGRLPHRRPAAGRAAGQVGAHLRRDRRAVAVIARGARRPALGPRRVLRDDGRPPRRPRPDRRAPGRLVRDPRKQHCRRDAVRSGRPRSRGAPPGRAVRHSPAVGAPVLGRRHPSRPGALHRSGLPRTAHRRPPGAQQPPLAHARRAQQRHPVRTARPDRYRDRPARARRHHRHQARRQRRVTRIHLMSISMLLDMAASAYGGRTALGPKADGINYESLRRTVAAGAGLIGASDAGSVAYIGLNGPALPALLMVSAVAGVPFSPLNYRLSTDGLNELLNRLDRPLVVVDEAFAQAVNDRGQVMTVVEWFDAASETAEVLGADVADDRCAVLLFTSGTTGRPKALSSGPGCAARALQTTSSSGARCPARPRESCCDGSSLPTCLSRRLSQLRKDVIERMQLKIGARYRSQVCQTELIVVRPLPGEADLTCGGHAVIDLKDTPAASLSLKVGADTGNALGKRYTDASGTLELLITKPGKGTLALGGEPLSLKEAKPLPASD